MIAHLLAASLAFAPTLAASPDPAPSPAPAPADAKAVRYCIQATTTGTRMARKTCFTRAEWLKQGIDPLAPAE